MEEGYQRAAGVKLLALDDIETAGAMVSRIMQMSHAMPMRGPDLRLTT